MLRSWHASCADELCIEFMGLRRRECGGRPEAGASLFQGKWRWAVRMRVGGAADQARPSLPSTAL
ncbi:MAG: hypothetical protein DWQ36_10895 [Acidobacteria bacterium]|nr:MAG: hypothetical protein DWQ30_12505 [Acidobacteriota bacterium]REK07718.1 MAG: hypothetical protein DWQ36_10895 [Acidobacteriota bacterium]